MNSIASILCSLSIILVFWIFTAVMIDVTLTRKNSTIKTILTWISGLIFLIISCALLMLLHGMLELFVQESAFDTLGYLTDTLIVILVTVFFTITAVKNYEESPSAKIFAASFYVIITLSCSDIALILMKILLPAEQYYNPVYFIGQSGFLVLFMTAIFIIALPRISKNIRELIKSVGSNMGSYIFVPVFTYLSYLAICTLWNTQPGDFMIIPQIVTRIIVIVLTIVMYVVVIYSIKRTAKMIEIDDEMKTAKTLQTEILPKDSTLKEIPYADFSAYISPYREIGGDFYDVFKVDNEKYGILIADVSGNSIPAALLMMMAKTIMNTSARDLKMPAASLSAANREIMYRNEACMFVTVFFGIIYPYGKFVYSCAGHNPPLILRDGKVSELSFPKAPVIGIDEYSYKNTEIELEDGDTVFLYTDGLIESVRKYGNGEEEIYGINRLIAAVKKGKNAEEIISTVKADYKEFTYGREQLDDVTMLAFTYHR